MGPSGFGWQSGPEVVEPLAEGVQGDAAEVAKLDVGQPGAAEIGQDGGPIDFAGREGHGAVSGDRSVTGPIMRTSREILKMHFTGRLLLILHGEDSPCTDWLERVVLAFRLDRRSVRVLFDEHERTMAEDRKRVLEVLGVPAS